MADVRELREIWIQMREMIVGGQQDQERLEDCKKRFIDLVNSSSGVRIYSSKCQVRLPNIVTAVFDYSQETPALQLWYFSNVNDQVCYLNLYFHLPLDFSIDGGG